jgi:hypothetical protein
MGRATTPDDFAGADAMVEALDDRYFGTVIGVSLVGIAFGGSPYDWHEEHLADHLRLA